MLFGGYGRSYDRNQFDFMQLEMSTGSFTTAEYFFQGDTANPCDASATNCVPWDASYLTQSGLDSLIASTEVRGTRYMLPNDLKMPYSDQMSFGVRSVFGDWNTEVSLARVVSKNGFNWLLGNRLPNGEFFQEGTNWGSPWGYGIPGWGSLIIATNDGETRANNLYFKLNRSHKDGWGVNLAYTFTDAEENRVYSEVYAFDYESVGDYGWNKSVGVPDHRVVITGSYDLPWNIALTAKYTWSSERIFQYTLCDDNNQCTFERAEPSKSGYSRFDLALSKDFPTDYLIANSVAWIRFDVQNLFNEDNYGNFYLNPDLETFGQPNYDSASNGGMRQLKLSAGWRF